jgi:regulator of protease activity HflC (stomatin/prohibitin superfamily)
MISVSSAPTTAPRAVRFLQSRGMVLLGLFFLFTAFKWGTFLFTVHQYETVIITRFGKAIRTEKTPDCTGSTIGFWHGTALRRSARRRTNFI